MTLARAGDGKLHSLGHALGFRGGRSRRFPASRLKVELHTFPLRCLTQRLEGTGWGEGRRRGQPGAVAILDLDVHAV